MKNKLKYQLISNDDTPIDDSSQQKINSYFTSIQRSFKKSLEAILETARLVTEAKEVLNAQEWVALQEKFGSGAALSKYLQIGRHLEVLQKNKDKLPISVVSLYLIATKLNDHQIQACVESGAINQKSRNKDVEKVVSAKVVPESTPYDNCVKEEVVDDDVWKKHWIGMPEYVQEANNPGKTIRVHFRNDDDFEEFVSKYTQYMAPNQTITSKTKSIWYPLKEREDNKSLRWIEEE